MFRYAAAGGFGNRFPPNKIRVLNMSQIEILPSCVSELETFSNEDGYSR